MNNEELKQYIENQKLKIVKLGAKRTSLASLGNIVNEKTQKQIQEEIKELDINLDVEFRILRELEEEL